MKKKIIFLVPILVTLVSLFISLVSAQTVCNLDISLLNQDPYPAIPGDYVKIVFQVDGVDNPECENVFFELIEDFPIIFDEGIEPQVKISSGTYARDFKSFLLVPYKVQISEDAIDGDHPLQVRYASTSKPIPDSYQLADLDIRVEDVRADFEASIKDYNYATNILTLEILNIGKNDIEALTVEIPKQENIIIKGSKRNIIGSLDSNEDTTFTFEAIPSEGEVKLNIFYTDKINVRRSIEKTIYFDSSYFTERKRDEKKTPTALYVGIAIAVLLIIIWIRRAIKRRNKKHNRIN